ncbi:hypothetical protein E2320_015918 [Naja naja]|nr:hypothetical protein E2320_015918 [Naja naja]
MSMATGKNLIFIPKKTQHYFLFCFLLKFSLTICSCLACFGYLLQDYCANFNSSNFSVNVTGCFSLVLQSGAERPPDWFGTFSNVLLLAQKFTAGMIVLHIVFISVTHVHRTKPLWKKSPFTNFWWTLTVVVVLLGQVVQTFLDLKLWVNLESPVTYQMDDIPMASWLLGLLSLVLVVIINETVKLHEIRVRVRYQKRQKLQFETKLGMNSPF